MNMFYLAVAVTAAFAVQIFLGQFQIRHFTAEYSAMREQGRVVIGRQSGRLLPGAIVLFQIDDNGIIRASKKIEGRTFLARVCEMEGFTGKPVATLNGHEVKKMHRNLRKAVINAAKNYNSYLKGECEK